MLPGPRLLSYGMEQLLWVCRRHMTRFLYSSDTTVYSRTAMLYLSIALSNITRPHLLCACSVPYGDLRPQPGPVLPPGGGGYLSSRSRSARQFRSRSWPAQTKANTCFDLYRDFPPLSLTNSWDSGGKETYEKSLNSDPEPSLIDSRLIESCDAP